MLKLLHRFIQNHLLAENLTLCIEMDDDISDPIRPALHEACIRHAYVWFTGVGNGLYSQFCVDEMENIGTRTELIRQIYKQCTISLRVSPDGRHKTAGELQEFQNLRVKCAIGSKANAGSAVRQDLAIKVSCHLDKVTHRKAGHQRETQKSIRPRKRISAKLRITDQALLSAYRLAKLQVGSTAKTMLLADMTETTNTLYQPCNIGDGGVVNKAVLDVMNRGQWTISLRHRALHYDDRLNPKLWHKPLPRLTSDGNKKEQEKQVGIYI
jgi:hypothetical protein